MALLIYIDFMALLIYYSLIINLIEGTLMEQLVHSPQSLGAVLQRARKTKHLNQKEAGLPFNIEQSTVASLEKGAPGTRLETLFRMLAALDLEMVIRTRNKTPSTNAEGW